MPGMPVSSRRVPPSGPRDAKIAFIGEGPGVDEDKYQKPFVGKSGKVLWEMAKDYAHVDRRDVYVDNLSQYRLTDNKGKDRGPTEEEFALLAPELGRRLQVVQPEVIVSLGRYSTRAVLGQDIPMEVCHGLVYPFFDHVAIPSYHPAAGLHQPPMLAFTAEDLKVVGLYLAGVVTPKAPQNQFPTPHYAIIRAAKPALTLYSPIAIDTEYDPITGEPWCLTFTCASGEAMLIRADDAPTLAAFKRGLEIARPEVILHFALADIAPLRKMGIDLIAMGLKIRDTGIELFLTQLNPQGLKKSTARLCGMSMREYEDVIGPVAEEFAREYLFNSILEPPADWGIGVGRKHSILKRIEGLLYPRKTVGGGESRSIREKWQDDSFTAVRTAVELEMGPVPQPTMDDIPKEEFRDYACGDADGTFRQAGPLNSLMDSLALREVSAVDHGIIPIVERMQQVGLRVDTRRLDELRDYVQDEITAYREICCILTGIEDFNPASGDQVAEFCTKMDLGLTKLTKGRKRIQVDENALIAIRYAHPAIEAVLTFRELDKLRGTYIEPLYGLLVGRGRYRRLYGHFRLTAAITGRLSMFDPNLMAFPTRTEVGRRLRRCFVAAPGRRIGSCDLSQIELRVGAALSQDEKMIDAFARGADIHLETAMSMFDLPAESIDELLHRYPAKTTNFAMFFGATGRRLYSEFLKAGIPGWDEGKCDGFVERWFELYSGVREWIDATCFDGAANGFVRTAAGRLRFLPALRFTRTDYPFNRVREEAQRHASNFPVQGTAQEIEKRGMKTVWDEVIPAVQGAGYYFEPLLQIHDDLMTEFDEDAEPLVKDLMLEAMTRESPWFGVPIKASWKSGTDWGSLEK